MTTEKERELWRKLVDSAIHSANVETEEWLKEQGMYEEYLERVKECEQRQQKIANSETEKVL